MKQNAETAEIHWGFFSRRGELKIPENQWWYVVDDLGNPLLVKHKFIRKKRGGGKFYSWKHFDPKTGNMKKGAGNYKTASLLYHNKPITQGSAVIVLGGEKDVDTADRVWPDAPYIFVCGSCGESSARMDIQRMSPAKAIYVFYDADDGGRSGAVKVSHAIQTRLPKHEVRYFALDDLEDYPGFDLSDAAEIGLNKRPAGIEGVKEWIRVHIASADSAPVASPPPPVEVNGEFKDDAGELSPYPMNYAGRGSCTDEDVCEWIVEQTYNCLLWDEWRNAWYFFLGGVWMRVNGGVIVHHLIKRARFALAREDHGEGKEEKARREVIHELGSQPLRSRVLKMLKSQPRVEINADPEEPDFWNPNPRLVCGAPPIEYSDSHILAFLEGELENVQHATVYDLDTMRVRQARKADRIRLHLAVSLPEKDIMEPQDVVQEDWRKVIGAYYKQFCPRLLELLQVTSSFKTSGEEDVAVDPDWVLHVEERFGWAMTAENDVQQFWFLPGKGGNGKGFLIQLQRRILGKLGKKASIGAFNWQAGSPGHGNAIAELEGAHMAFLDEVGGRLNIPLVKEVSGEPTIKASRKHQAEREFRSPTLVMSGNKVPKLDSSPAVERRLVATPFDMEFGELGKPNVTARARDRSIMMLELEPELKYIAYIRLILYGRVRWVGRKTNAVGGACWTECGRVLANTQTVLVQGDEALQELVEDYLDFGPSDEFKEHTVTLRKAYTALAEERGQKNMLSGKHFTVELKNVARVFGHVVTSSPSSFHRDKKKARGLMGCCLNQEGRKIAGVEPEFFTGGSR